jgi:hypothetical protein
MVFLGFEAAWFFAASPTNRSSSVKATYEGVIRCPWSLTRISTLPFCITPTQEYVVPRSIPMTAADTLADALECLQLCRCSQTYQCHSFLVMGLDHSVRGPYSGTPQRTEGQRRQE